jgi:hypothetical protein
VAPSAKEDLVRVVETAKKSRRVLRSSAVRKLWAIFKQITPPSHQIIKRLLSPRAHPLQRERREGFPRELSNSLALAFTLQPALPNLAAAAMAITAPSPDILGERQSGQDVRTQNGNRIHPYRPLPLDSTAACGGLGDPVARVAVCSRSGLITVFFLSFADSDGVRSSGQHRQILVRPRRPRQGMRVIHLGLFGIYYIYRPQHLVDPNFTLVNHGMTS